MSGRIPENVLEDILSRVDIVEVISGYLPLKRAGRNFKATCPFHHEKTPSFMVSPDRQIYHCFGCGESGNAFRFLMRYERMEFREAVDVLAQKAGVALPKTAPADPRTASLITQLYKINESATLLYSHHLHSAAGSATKQYLLKRGIREDAINSFRLGFAPDAWDTLINHMRAKNISLSLLEKSGLILAKESGGYYDRFRGRVIFPIFDVKSRVIGFGARVLDNTLPKYVNSPETPVYTKGKNLYGFNFSKDEIKDKDCAVVVEGYLDFVMPFQEGLRHIVASLGTALTVEQARLLKRYTHNVVIVYDGDDAGQIATLRSLDLFIEEGIAVKVVSLPQGFDPDSFVRKNGIEDFKHKITHAESLFDYKLKILKSRYNPREIEGRAKISTEMLATINKFKNAVLRSEYIKKLADDLKVEEGALREELKNAKQELSYTDAGHAPKKPFSVNAAERLILRLMLEEHELINRIRESLAPEDFQDERISQVVSLVFDSAEQGKHIEPRSLVNYFDDENILQLICESSFSDEVSLEHKEKMLVDCIGRLKSQRIKLRREYLHEQIKKAQTSGEEEALRALMREFQDLFKQGVGKK